MQNEETDDFVTLLIEQVPLKCKKQELIDNSNYFKAMFEGNFAERDQTVVTLEEIDLESLKLIISLLKNETTEQSTTLTSLKDDELLPILQTACMLQFESIQTTCNDILTEKLNPLNCIKIWFLCEPHGIRPLYLKAKNLALIEFDFIKETSSLLELDLTQLHSYLANVDLQCKSELDVFTVCMSWFYENGDSDVKTAISLLFCVDFRSASEKEVKEMSIAPDIHNNKVLSDVFNLICRFKTLELNIELNHEDETIFNVAKSLFNSRKRNKSFVDPVVFVKRYLNEKSNDIEQNEDNVEFCYDAYKRKRKYMRIGDVDESVAALFIYNMQKERYIKCIDVPSEKYVNCEGFHIIGYKEQIFFFGGEFTLGRGHWNLNFWVYDTIRERWERKTRLPSGRRHFQSCICGPYLYIIGGTGTFRIIQDNMFWYNYIDNIWSTRIHLPCTSGQLRCCNLNDQLLMLNVSNKCGYLFSHKLNAFVKLDFEDEHNLVTHFPPHYSLFAYDNRVYVKSTNLIEFQLVSNKLTVTNVFNMAACAIASYEKGEKQDGDNLSSYADVMESIVCNEHVLTLYKCTQTKAVQVEIMPLNDSYHRKKFVKYLLPTKVEEFNIDVATKLFALQHHYKMVDCDSYVNELIDCDKLDLPVGVGVGNDMEQKME